MKAIVQDTYGTADVLRLEEIDRPECGDDEVLLQVRAAGVDPGVWHLMTGLPYLVRIMGFGFRGPKVRTPGMDVAGRVESIGKNVTQLEVGDEVFGTCEGTPHGAFAEYACALAEKLAPRPTNLTFEQAAAVPTSALTALQGLRDQGQLQAGQRALIIGASGGVGAFAVQLAKDLGAEVTGVCSTAKVDKVRSIGADQVVDYTREDFVEMDQRYDVILDTAGNRSLSHLRRALTPRGTLVIVGGEGGGPWLGGTDRQIRALLLSPFVRHRMRVFVATATRKDLEHLKGLIEAGGITPLIDRTYSLAEVPDAIRYLERGHAGGKVVISL